MADTIPVSCPKCQKELRVPANLAGKTIRCKDCQTAFKIPAEAPPPAALPAKKVKKAALANAPKPGDDDEDGGPKEYGLDQSAIGDEVSRCPHCADVLDPPDTKICLNCGYDLLQRFRHESTKTYDLTAGDWFRHHISTFICLVIVGVLIAIIVVSILKMDELFVNMGLENDKENEVTKKKGFVVPPGACTTPLVVACLFGIFRAGSFAFKKLVFNFRPTEMVKKT